MGLTAEEGGPPSIDAPRKGSTEVLPHSDSLVRLSKPTGRTSVRLRRARGSSGPCQSPPGPLAGNVASEDVWARVAVVRGFPSAITDTSPIEIILDVASARGACVGYPRGHRSPLGNGVPSGIRVRSRPTVAATRVGSGHCKPAVRRRVWLSVAYCEQASAKGECSLASGTSESKGPCERAECIWRTSPGH